MEAVDLQRQGTELLELASSASSGRRTSTIHSAPDVGLSQILLALVAGQRLSDHENPGDATLQVLSGRVLLSAGSDEWTVAAGRHLTIPRRRHALLALDDSVVLLTFVKAS